MPSMITDILQWFVELIYSWGYPGIIITTFLESTFIPLPSEITVIPVGYLIQQGKMNWIIAYLCSVIGSLGGSLFSYWLAYHYGRRFLLRYSRYFFLDEEKLNKVERYFAAHGSVSVFTARFIPGLRHFSSFPAGLAKMDLKLFCLYTTLGAGIWMAVLMALGYFIGQNHDLLKQYVHDASFILLALVAVGVAFYVWHHKRRASRNSLPS